MARRANPSCCAGKKFIASGKPGKKAASPGKTLIAGTGAEATAETIEHTNRAATLGYDAALVRTPHFYKPQMKLEALAEYYLRVADAARIPVLVYSVPIFTNLQVDSSLIARVAQHPNVIGMKDSSGDVEGVRKIIVAAPKEFRTLVGSAATLFESLELGACGAILALANAFPELCLEIYEASRSGSSSQAHSLAQQLLGPGKNSRPPIRHSRPQVLARSPRILRRPSAPSSPSACTNRPSWKST